MLPLGHITHPKVINCLWFSVFPLHPATLLREYPQRPSLGIAPFGEKSCASENGIDVTCRIYCFNHRIIVALGTLLQSCYHGPLV